MKKDPENDMLKKQSAEIGKQLQEAYEKEKQGKSEIPEDGPLNSAIELMALSTSELNKFIRFYKKIDFERKGHITLTQLFEELSVLDNAFSRQV
jgi:antitoxin component HigA of HigAB toxin-antitoxin module